MTRLSSAFTKANPALVTFITAGDGDTAANLDALVAGGAVKMDREAIILANLCGRGDKDIFTVAEALGTEI